MITKLVFVLGNDCQTGQFSNPLLLVKSILSKLLWHLSTRIAAETQYHTVLSPKFGERVENTEKYLNVCFFKILDSDYFSVKQVNSDCKSVCVFLCVCGHSFRYNYLVNVYLKIEIAR